MEPLRRCSTCQADKPATLEFFYAKKRGLFGLSPDCKKCCSKKAAARAARRRATAEGKAARNAYERSHRKTLGGKEAERRRHNTASYLAWAKDRYEVRKKIPSVRLRWNLRSRLNTAIKHGWKAGSAVRDLGCTIPELKAYLEAQFRPGMSWDNWARDGWHIDHRKPLAKFDLSDPEQLRQACHYTNLQPLWASENISKSDSTQPEALS